MAPPRSEPRRTRRQAGDAREHILAVAEERFSTLGLDGLKLVEIAAAAGVRHSTLLHHFGSAAGLHEALVERIVGRLVAETSAILQGDDLRLSASAAASAVYRLFAREGTAKLVAWLALAGAEPKIESLGAPFDRILERLEAHTREAGFPAAEGKALARAIVRITVTSAIGEGLAGSRLDRVMPPEEGVQDLPLETALATLILKAGGFLDEGQL
ncbi:MAG: TetR/AcrR family transcriptional regulator [Alphaproteobacteria bacterium]|nr:TetR/AcrR family transcriptional regulator [Alphaproteobacteria bacterium]